MDLKSETTMFDVQICEASELSKDELL